MQRGKADVQYYERRVEDMLRTLICGTETTMVQHEGRSEKSEIPDGEPEEELAGHIVTELRNAYAELLEEPIPEHLQKLLIHLSQVEEKS